MRGPDTPGQAKPAPDPVPRLIVVPGPVYARLLEAARWMYAAPGWVGVPEHVLDEFQNFYEEQLRKYVPGEISIIDVETGLGCGLVALLEAYDAEGKLTGEVRARIRRAK
jgi:hypothetical protein